MLSQQHVTIWNSVESAWRTANTGSNPVGATTVVDTIPHLRDLWRRDRGVKAIGLTPWLGVRFGWLRGPETTCRRTCDWDSVSRSGSKSLLQSRPRIHQTSQATVRSPPPRQQHATLTCPLTFPTHSLGRTIAARRPPSRLFPNVDA